MKKPNRSKAIFKATWIFSLALIAWSAVLVLAGHWSSITRIDPAKIAQLQSTDILAIFLFGIGAILFALRFIGKPLLTWVAGPWTVFDSFSVCAMAVGLILSLSSLTGILPANPYILSTLSAAPAVVVAIRQLVPRFTPKPKPFPAAAPSLFDEILTGTRMAPIEEESQDELARGNLVGDLYDLTSRPRNPSLNFGIEGSWGSGKSSLLNLVRNRLEKDGITIVSFDLWSYREPAQLIRAYFARLATIISDKVPGSGSTQLMRRLAAGLLEFSGSRIHAASKAIFGDFSTEALEDVRERIAEALTTLDQPIVVLLDDLDRLDRDELSAVIRSARLMSDLPNLTQVLAYDREQIAKTLFPEDPTGTRARDYIGKLVNVEYSIGDPPLDLTQGLLAQALNPFLGSLNELQAEDFKERLLIGNFRLLARALPTPREARRVVASVASRWRSMSRHLNAADLFMLTTLQYRFPSIYQTIRSRPEWFTENSWSSDVDLILNPARQEELASNRKIFLDNLIAAGRQESLIAGEVLDILFPGLSTSEKIFPSRPESGDESTSRKARRIYHPSIIGRYFQLYVAEHIISEAEIEDFEEEVKGIPAGRQRQSRITSRFSEATQKGQLNSFLEQWKMVFAPEQLTEDWPLVQDLTLGLARSAHLFSEEAAYNTLPQVEVAAYECVFFSFIAPSASSATELLIQVIEEATNLALPRKIIRLFPLGKIRGLPEPRVEADEAPLMSAMEQKVLNLYINRPAALLEASPQERAGAIFGTRGSAKVRQLIADAIRAEPTLLPELLKIFSPYRNKGASREILTDLFDPTGLPDYVDPRVIDSATSHLPLDTWKLPGDREVVERFRHWFRNDFNPGDEQEEGPED